MTIKISQVRSAVASQIHNALNDEGFTESRIPPDYFGRNENTIAHKRYAVQTNISNAFVERQRRAVGCMMETEVIVKFAYRLRPKDAYPTDYDNGLNAEEQIIKAVLSSYVTIRSGLEIRYLRSAREISDSTEWMLFQVEFITYHTIEIN